MIKFNPSEIFKEAKVRSVRKLYVAISMILFTVIVGITGFHVIEDYTFTEAFYMTIITISTVGFHEVHELSDAGRIFTSFLIITNIGIFAYAISTVTSFIIEGEFRDIFNEDKMEKSISKLKNYTVVCGFGRNGREVCEELKQNKKNYIVIERNEDIIDTYKNEGIIFISGDATDDNILSKANLENADSLISTLPKDADNVFVVLTARSKNPKMSIVSRASEESSESKLKHAGVDRVIIPEKIGGTHMASLIIHPDVVEFLELIRQQEGFGISFEEFDFDKITKSFKNKSIRELDIRNKTGANIIGLKREDGEYIINPSADNIIGPNCKLIVLGNSEQIRKVNDLLLN